MAGISIGKRYEDCNFVVCHIGGVSVSAHRRDCMIDGHDIAGGEGPIAPTRCGTIPSTSFCRCWRRAASPAENCARSAPNRHIYVQ